MKTNAMLIAAGIGGLVMGLVSGLPLINAINCLFCVGIWGSGILAVYLYKRQTAEQLSNGQGAALGALAGVIGGIISSILGAIFSAGAGAASALAQLQDIPGMDPELLNSIPMDMLATGGFSIGGMLCSVVLYAAFGAVGGLIATALIWKKG